MIRVWLAAPPRVPLIERQRLVRADRGALVQRSARCADCAAMLGLVSCRRTRCVHFVHCAQTTATSQFTKRAARAATSPALLAAEQARRRPSARAFAGALVVRERRAFHGGGCRGRRSPVGAICGATSSAGSGASRASALPELTCRSCLSAVNEVNAASSAARPRPEQQSAVAAALRPPRWESPPGTACRDALEPARIAVRKELRSSHPTSCSS